MDYSKRESEIILVEADFSALFAADEDISSCAVTAYGYGGSAFSAEDFDLEEADYVVIEVLAGTDMTRKSFPTTGYETARLSLIPETFVAASIITAASLDVSGNAKQTTDTVTSVQIESGTAGYSYRVVFTATTNYGDVYVIEKTVAVTSD